MGTGKCYIFCFAFIASLWIAHDAASSAYEQVLHENHESLKIWSVPLVRLSVLDASQNPGERHVLNLEVKVVEVFRNGPINLKNGVFHAQWRTHRKRAEIARTFQSQADNEPIGNDLITTLKGASLICFTGLSFPQLTLYAYECFNDNDRNRTIAKEFYQERPLSNYLYKFAQNSILIFPLLGFILVFFAPRAGMAIACLTYPSFIYYNAHVSATTIRYDYLIAYPAMILSALVIAFGLVRWLHQMVTEEQAEKARTRENETPKSD